MHNHLLGGGFGRRLEADMVESAVRIAKQVDGPVKVVWTREEDMQHDVYRPAYRDVISATLSNGKIAAWKYEVTGSSVMARWLPPAFQNGIDIDAVDSAVDMPYDIPNKHVEYVRAEPPARDHRLLARRRAEQQRVRHRVLHRRAGAQGRQGSGRFPPRHARQQRRGCKAALELVAEKSGWGSPLPAARRPRRLRAAVVRQLHRHRGRGRGRR